MRQIGALAGAAPRAPRRRRCVAGSGVWEGGLAKSDLMVEVCSWRHANSGDEEYMGPLVSFNITKSLAARLC